MDMVVQIGYKRFLPPCAQRLACGAEPEGGDACSGCCDEVNAFMEAMGGLLRGAVSARVETCQGVVA